MSWEKLGKIYDAKRIDKDLISHASNPMPIFLEDDKFRIFFSGRDHKNRSSVGYVDIDVKQRKVIGHCEGVIIAFGRQDSFYSHGISVGNNNFNNGKNYVYFMGWNIPKGGHWRGDIGRLELTNKSTLILAPDVPFLGIDQEDPISLSYPFVLFHEGIYKMWYGSTVSWESENGEMIHVIKYATSDDGEHWEKHGVAIPYELGVAQAFSRPSVIIDDNGYHMWYSYRSGTGTTYRIGYAYSANGKDWTRAHEKAGIDVSDAGWDSEMICYPFVFEHNDTRYMLYNGNDFGRFGFGLAIWKE